MQTNLFVIAHPRKQLCRGIIKLLKDSSSEVQGMAMKCLAPLAVFVHDDWAVYMVEKLLEPIVNSDLDSHGQPTGPAHNAKSMRDVAFLGLKSILTELPSGDHKSNTIARTNVPKILQAVRSSSKSNEVQIEALELLNELLKKLGDAFPDRHQEAISAIFLKLDSENPVIRKRAINCLGSVGAVCSDKRFNDIMSVTIDNLTCTSSDIKRRTGVQAVWALARSSGSRLGSYLDIVVPIFFEFCQAEKYENDDELREYCLQALESFCTHCRKQMIQFIPTLKNILLILARHDPNCALEDEDEIDDVNSDCQEMDAEDADDDDDFLDIDDDDFSDDEDASWKVRRSAIRCTQAVISGQLLPVVELYETFGLFLVSRFKERAENVKLDAFAAFVSLLKVRTLPTHTSSTAAASESADFGEMGNAMDVSGDFETAMDVDSAEIKELAPLLDRALHIVRTLRKELGGGSNKTRVTAISVLSELVAAAPNTFCALFAKLVQEVERALGDDAAEVKQEALRFVKAVVSGDSNSVTQFVGQLVPKILITADDRYYKITAESLRLCTSFVCAFGTSSDECRNSIRTHCAAIYDTAEKRIVAQDQDSEVKEAALDCLGAVVAYFGNELDEKRLSTVGKTLCGRLKNEVTRLASVRAMLRISLSEKRSVFSPVSSIITATVVGFLRKNNPNLRAASLELLASLPKLAEEADHELLRNVSILISESDMKLSHFALRLCSSLIKARGGSICAALSEERGVYVQVLKLTTSPLLQGRVVSSLLNFYRDLAAANGQPLTIDKLGNDLHGLLCRVEMTAALVTSRSSPLSILTKCLTVVCMGADQQSCLRVASELVNSISSNNPKERVFALICLGEFGKRSLFVNGSSEQTKVQQTILSVLDSSAIEVQTAAALALGGLSSASGPEGIPALVDLIHERPLIRYLLLLSLKDTIEFSPREYISNSCGVLLSLLLEAIPQSQSALTSQDSQEKLCSAESIRIASSECLGLLMQALPTEVIPAMRRVIPSEIADVRACVVSALRFAVSTRFRDVNAADVFVKELKPALGEFIKLIADSDVTVAKNTLYAVHALARSRPSYLTPLISQIMGDVFKRTEKNSELIRIVDLGPFKHEEDFGLDLRKASFGIMRTIANGVLAHEVAMEPFIEAVVRGLQDTQDVRAIAQQIVISLAGSTRFNAKLARYVEPIRIALEKTLSLRIKENAVRQEVERHEESIRGAIRTVCALEKVNEIGASKHFSQFVNNVVKRKFFEQYDAVVKESKLLGMSVESGTAASNNQPESMVE